MKWMLLLLLSSNIAYANTVDVNCSNEDKTIISIADSHGFEITLNSTDGELSTYTKKEIWYKPLSDEIFLFEKEVTIDCDEEDGIRTYLKTTGFSQDFSLEKRDGSIFSEWDDQATISDTFTCEKVERLIGPCE